MASSTGCGAWYTHLDAFGFMQKQDDLEAPLDERDQDAEAVRAIEEWQVPLDANTDADYKGGQAALGDLDHQGTPSPAQVRLAELCANHDTIDMDAITEAESATDYPNFSDSNDNSIEVEASTSSDFSPQNSDARIEADFPYLGTSSPGFEVTERGVELSKTDTNDVSPYYNVNSSATDFPYLGHDTGFEVMENDGELTKAKELIHSSPSFTTADDTMDESQTTTSDSTLSNESSSQKKHWRYYAVVGLSITLMLIIVLSTLGAKGYFSINEPSQPSSASPQGDTGAINATGSGNGHDTEKPPPDTIDTDDTIPPTETLTTSPIVPPTEAPSPPTPPPPPVTYVPGLLTVEENGLVLSEGLSSRLIATRRRPVEYANGELSQEPFHRRPDYGACFPVPPDATENQGGWVYVSNSEIGGPPSGMAGVGALYFNKDGNVIDYKMLLTGTTTNCAGGRTPWGTFVSCEEVTDIGKIYQVDPFDRRPPEQITMGKLGGRYESFTHDDRDKNAPRFFATEDKRDGPTIRWTPDPESIDWEEPWDMLASGSGTMEYLYLKPDPANKNASGTFEWTTNLERARQNAELYAQGTEGIDRNENLLYFVCKTDSLFYILDLDSMTFVMYPANIGLFDGEPDQVNRMVNDTQDILYFTEAGTAGISGIHGRNSKGQYFTILESPGYETEETTGLAFSPNGLHMYVALQDPGVLFDITRTDGYPFHGMSLEVRYHNPPLDHLLRP